MTWPWPASLLKALRLDAVRDAVAKGQPVKKGRAAHYAGLMFPSQRRVPGIEARAGTIKVAWQSDATMVVPHADRISLAGTVG